MLLLFFWISSSLYFLKLPHSLPRFTTILAFLMLFYPHEFVLTRFKHFVNNFFVFFCFFHKFKIVFFFMNSQLIFNLKACHHTLERCSRFLLHWLQHSYVPFVQKYLKNEMFYRIQAVCKPVKFSCLCCVILGESGVICHLTNSEQSEVKIKRPLR